MRVAVATFKCCHLHHAVDVPVLDSAHGFRAGAYMITAIAEERRIQWKGDFVCHNDPGPAGRLVRQSENFGFCFRTHHLWRIAVDPTTCARFLCFAREKLASMREDGDFRLIVAREGSELEKKLCAIFLPFSAELLGIFNLTGSARERLEILIHHITFLLVVARADSALFSW